MFGKSKVTQSMIDAVNQVIAEKQESNPEILEEGKTVQVQPGVTRHYASADRYGGSERTTDALSGLAGPGKKDLEKIEKEKKKEKKEESVDFKSKFLSTLEEDRLVEQEINEVLSKDASAGDWIHDFVRSDNPKFEGKSKTKRKQMALAAYYAKQRNEETEIEEELKGDQHKIDKNKNKRIDAHDFAILRGKKKAVKEETDTTEKEEMVQAQLHFIKYACEEILDYIEKGGEVEEWYQVKIAKSFSEFESLHSFMEGEARRTGMKEEVELNEVSKSEVEHHFNNWTNSEHAPYHRDAGDDNKIHQSALSYLKSTNVPKENHEKMAMHIAHKFHGSGIDESTPPKNTDVADKSYLKDMGKKPTVKSDIKNFGRFLAGKKETNEGKQPETDNVPFAPPYNTTSDAVVTDKSGAKHSPMSRVKHLARQAMQKVQKDLGKK
jgi:hypothetical protein